MRGARHGARCWSPVRARAPEVVERADDRLGELRAGKVVVGKALEPG